MKSDKSIPLFLKISNGLAIFFGLFSLFVLFSGKMDMFLGSTAMAVGFGLLSWAGRRIALPLIEGKLPLNVGTVVGIIFGGAGLLMLFGSILLFIEGDFGGSIGLAIFGLVFCGAGYGGYRVFAEPKGKKAIKVSQHRESFIGPQGQNGQRTSQRFVYVDENLPEAEIGKMQKEWTEKPWTQRSDWAAGKVVQEGPGSMKLLTGFTIVWNLMGWGIALFAIISEWNSGDIPWFIIAFPIFGFGLIIVTLRTWIRRRKYGISVLTLDTLPAYLGDHLRGSVQTGLTGAEFPAQGVILRLACYERSTYYDKEGDSRVAEKKRWSAEQHLDHKPAWGSGKFLIPIDFAIPSDLPPSEIIPEDDRVFWRLEISAKTRGIDYAAQFEVPVYEKNREKV